MPYNADQKRYDTMIYNRSGRSGLKLPAISLGTWCNFGEIDVFETGRQTILRAFDLGITHFDTANCYGPPVRAAEETLGRVFAKDLHPYRDEIVVATKAAAFMCPGPYGTLGARKTMLASLNNSLKCLGLDYVDIFYSHRPDPETPLEETMGAMDQAVRSGKALYVGISNYSPEMTAQASKILKSLGTPCLIHQPAYSMFVRDIENTLLPVLEDEGIGCIVFSPLAQGLLTNRYLKGIPNDSRAAKTYGGLKTDDVTPEVVEKIKKLNDIAQERGQTLAQMAIAWVLRDGRVTSALIGTSSVKQLEDNVAALNNLNFAPEEIEKIDSILG